MRRVYKNVSAPSIRYCNFILLAEVAQISKIKKYSQKCVYIPTNICTSLLCSQYSLQTISSSSLCQVFVTLSKPLGSLDWTFYSNHRVRTFSHTLGIVHISSFSLVYLSFSIFSFSSTDFYILPNLGIELTTTREPAMF